MVTVAFHNHCFCETVYFSLMLKKWTTQLTEMIEGPLLKIRIVETAQT